jgi:hypothetical protein
MKSKAVSLAAAAAAALSLSSCAYKAAASGVQGVVQNGGWTNMTDKTLIDCIKPMETKNELNRTVYWYPAHQISWTATNEPGNERGPYDVLSAAPKPNDPDPARAAAATTAIGGVGTDMLVPLTVSFDLTQDCDLLKQFHQHIGTKYNGWLKDEDGGETDGWKQLLTYVISQPLQNTLNNVSQGYTWQQIWNDESVRREFTDAITRELPQASKERTEGVAYFKNFQVSVYKPTPASAKLKDVIEQQQANVQQALSDQARAEAQLNTARAETATALAEAAKQQAIINGYGNIDDYNRAMAIQKGLNPFQPTYVVPQPAR